VNANKAKQSSIADFTFREQSIYNYFSPHPNSVVYGELTVEGCQSAGGRTERGGAEVQKLRPSLRCLPLTDVPRP